MSEGVAVQSSRADVFRRVTRYGMRGQRQGEAGNPGPRYFLRRRSTVVDVSSDEDSASARDAHRCRPRDISAELKWEIDLRLSHCSPMMMKFQRFHSVREGDVRC